MSLDKYGKERVEAILKHLPDDDEELLRAWVATSCSAEYKRGHDSGADGVNRAVAGFCGIATTLALFFIAWAATPEGWPLECPPEQPIPEGDTLRWYQPWGLDGPATARTDELACVQWAGTFACVPITKAPEALPAESKP